MPIFRGRKNRDDNDPTIKRGIVEGQADPLFCKSLGMHHDKKSGRCIGLTEKHKNHPKEIKIIEPDEYTSPDDEGGIRSAEE